MTRFRALLTALLFAFPALAQLTPEQKVTDLTQLANAFAKYYAPYEWKRDVGHFDMMDLKPWAEKARATKTDIEFMELLVDYVSSLNDGHVGIFFTSDFEADTGMSADIYDGKVLIDAIARSVLPANKFPFEIGDEIVSVDGKPVASLLPYFGRYYGGGYSRTTNRVGASRIFYRPQTIVPSAGELGTSLTIVVKRAAGQEETYSIPWQKYGTPFHGAGPMVGPRLARAGARAAETQPEEDGSVVPPYYRGVKPYTHFRIPKQVPFTNGWGSRTPVFSLPSNFVRRRGGSSSDMFYSGTYDYDGLHMGYIRIPDFEPLSEVLAISQFETELRYMQQNTDGIVLDVMRNPGGYGEYCEALLQRIMPNNFYSIGFEIRATSDWVMLFSQTVADAEYYREPDWVIALLKMNMGFIQMANSEVRGRTGPVSLNSTGSLLLTPASTVYTKPILLLTDELSASAADFFAAVFQDNNRGKIFGYRTMGLGGGPTQFDATYYTESYAYITRSLMVRKNPVKTPDFPETYYVENVGVRPDIEMDYMTRDNLINKGKTFVDGFSKAMAAHIRASQGK